MGVAIQDDGSRDTRKKPEPSAEVPHLALAWCMLCCPPLVFLDSTAKLKLLVPVGKLSTSRLHSFLKITLALSEAKSRLSELHNLMPIANARLLLLKYQQWSRKKCQ